MRKKMISLMMTVAMGTVMISGATVVKADSDEKETVFWFEVTKADVPQES